MKTKLELTPAETSLKNEILDISRQKGIGQLSPFFDEALDKLIVNGYFKTETAIRYQGEQLIDKLSRYGDMTGRKTVVLGMSGGVDSALTAALFKQAGYRVIGVTLPIHQNPEETNRGQEAIAALGLSGLSVDLSSAYDNMLAELGDVDSNLVDKTDDNATRIRRGNIRARLRMITLYNLASKYNGFVASTDNFSELATGFWTLHGDVGDVSPIQSLLKSWEVPLMSKLFGVPEATWRAKPTDGLGVANGDEDQFGCTYLELDIILGLMSQFDDSVFDKDFTSFNGHFNTFTDYEAHSKLMDVITRMSNTWFKRSNPINLKNPLVGDERYDLLRKFDQRYVAPRVFGKNGIL